MAIESTHWLQDMRSLQERVLTVVRDALRSDFAHAVAVLGITNHRLARKLSTMTVMDIEQVCEQMAPRLAVKLDESLAMELLVSNVLEPEIDPAVARLASFASADCAASAATQGPRV